MAYDHDMDAASETTAPGIKRSGAPSAGSEQEAKRSQTSSHAQSQFTAPAPQRGVTADAVLVPMERNPETGATTYVTLEKFKEQNAGKDAEAIKAELDQKAVLIKSPSGTYLTKPATYQTTYGGEGTDKDVREATKTKNFNERMDELGLSREKFDGKHEERLTGKDAIIETPGGNRRKFGNYVNPEQAGVNSPDVLVKHKDGSFEAFYPKTREDIKNLGDLKANYDEAYLKTKGHNYVSPETYEQRNGSRQQEKAFAYFKGEPFHNERQDLPKQLYRAAHGEYVSKQDYLASPGAKTTADGKIDYKQADVLFQSPSGKSLLTPKVMSRIDPKGYEAFLKEEGIEKGGLNNKIDRTRPEVMIAVNGRLIGADVARQAMSERGMDTSKPLTESFGRANVYVENLGKDGKGTGNYRDAPAAEARQNNRDTGRLEQLGVYRNEGQEKLAGMMKPGELFSKPAAAPQDRQTPDAAQNRSRDDRSRDGAAAMNLG